MTHGFLKHIRLTKAYKLFICFLFFVTVAYTLPTLAQDVMPRPQESPFATATDEQIIEAQRYYKYCAQNETLNAQKDCKCAATRFLETRLRLGATATPKDIIAANINACLKDEKRSRVDDYTDLSYITDAQMKEAEAIYKECQTTPRIRRYNDCECLGAAFLDERLKRGPIDHKDVILMDIHHCKNVVETTGMAYSECMSAPYSAEQPVEPKRFCECYARRWADKYGNFKGRVTSAHRVSFKVSARLECRQPDAYPKDQDAP